MKKLARHGLILGILLLLLLGTAAYMHRGSTKPITSMDTLLLLIPDSANENDPLIREWIDAAEEEGIHLQTVRDSSLLDPMVEFHATGLIVPDQVHRNANEPLISALHDYVHHGGKLMLVYDACTLDLNGFFSRYQSRLSDLVGVSYAQYDKYKKNTMELDQIWGDQQTMEALDVPPGKYIPLSTPSETPGWLQQVAWNAAPAKNNTRKFTFSRYLYNDLKYPAFRTDGAFDGKVLLESKNGLIAGLRKHELGQVLFVNLPLGYLESRTDGLLLHSFLHYFASEVLHLPYLASVPDGTGGLVLNWHIDAASALKPMSVLSKAGIFDQGPFSAHFTAGPDVDAFNDHKGLNVENNPEVQQWIRTFEQRGYAIGSHGGWIHNYFGEHLSDDNEKDFAQYIVKNNQALQDVDGGRPIREYSAPLGNHPEWVTKWLQAHGFVAYYFSGDTGMGPTRVYRDRGSDGNIWGFPILHLGTEASLEEMNFDSVPQPLVQSWLIGVTDYAARDHVARLVYSHPLGATRYVGALQSWMQHSHELASQGRFRWYTMTGLAEFLNSRNEVNWTLGRVENKLMLQASHPKTLEHQTWIFPKSQYRNLHVVQGNATIQNRDDLWLVTAKDCKHLAVELDGM